MWQSAFMVFGGAVGLGLYGTQGASAGLTLTSAIVLFLHFNGFGKSE